MVRPRQQRAGLIYVAVDLGEHVAQKVCRSQEARPHTGFVDPERPDRHAVFQHGVRVGSVDLDVRGLVPVEPEWRLCREDRSSDGARRFPSDAPLRADARSVGREVPRHFQNDSRP